MTNDVNVVEFSQAWAAAWNRRDVDAVLEHFHDDAIFTSPVAQRIGFAADGVIIGKDALRHYWVAALERNPRLHFDVTAVYQGVNTIVIAFRTQDGANRTEVLTFQEGLVVEGHGTFEAG